MSSRFAPVRTFLGRFVIALVVGSLLMAGVVAGVDREIAHKVDNIPTIDLTVAQPPPEGANYLLVGVDNLGGAPEDPLAQQAFGNRDKENNTDTMMVVHLEPRAERAIVVSFPRDLYVNIPGHGYNKLNAAFSFGATTQERAQLLIDTLYQNFGVDVHHYIELNFQSFVGLVNKLGNISVYVPYQAKDDFTGFGVPAGGCWSLDGEASLRWVRSRYLQYFNEQTGQWVYVNDRAPDYSRIGRQQDFMRKLAGLAVQKSLNSPFTANLVADEIIKNLRVDDNFDTGTVFDLIDAFRTLNPDDTSALQFSKYLGTPAKRQIGPDLLDVLIPQVDVDAPLIQRLNTFDQRPRPTPAPSSIKIHVINATGRQDLWVPVKQQLEEQGFVVTEAVDTNLIRPKFSTVKYAQGQADKGKLLQRYVEPTPDLAPADSDLHGADIEIILGKNFTNIAVPADALVTTTTTVNPDQSAEEGELSAPVETPPSPDDIVLPNPAPRGAC
jgi:LCP family protein required for cell wall assembly